MRMRASRWTAAVVIAGVGTAGLLTASPARADCVYGGGSTVCAQGEVRGAEGAPPTSGSPYVPYPCDYDPYCYDGGLSIILDPGDGPNRPPRPRPPRPTPRQG